MIPRVSAIRLKELASKIPVLTVTGPRQSGKSTLVKATFPGYRYLNLESIDVRQFAEQDPRGFISECRDGAIIDEIQNVPSLLSYIQVHVDEAGRNGQFIVTGSQNLLLVEKISQSLAGRTIIITLLPLSLEELQSTGATKTEYEKLIFKGFYPRLFSTDITPSEWLPSYIHTYVERDVRTIVNTHDISTFQMFIRLCAGRVGQLLNLSSLGNDVGVNQQTIKRWISILEATYIVFILRPYHSNFNKRLIKAPKLFFYDTGLACSLLGIRSAEELKASYMKGPLFENLVIAELIKNSFNRCKEPRLYFWRDSNGHEVDCLVETGNKIFPMEIKSSQTLSDDFFAELRFFCNISGTAPQRCSLIYGGNERLTRQKMSVFPWRTGCAIEPTTIEETLG